MNFKKVITGSLIGAGMLATPAAFAGFTGNVGATSKYLFRGVSQGGSAAVQGGIDYSHDASGFYAGTWASNVGFAGSDGGGEVDIYGGWSKEFSGLTVDLGVLYYWYPEEDEVAAELNTVEFYGGLGYGPISFTYYYSDENNFFIGDGQADEAAYALLGLELPITDSLAFTASVGLYSGDEIERFLTGIGSTDDDYVDYSIGLSKSLDGGYGFSLQLVDTDIEAGGVDDEPQVLVGFSKEFDL